MSLFYGSQSDSSELESESFAGLALAGWATCFFFEGREDLTISSSSLLLSEEELGAFFLDCLGATTAAGLTAESLVLATLVEGAFTSTPLDAGTAASLAYLFFSCNFLASFSAFFSALVLGTSTAFSACFPAVSTPFD